MSEEKPVSSKMNPKETLLLKMPHHLELLDEMAKEVEQFSLATGFNSARCDLILARVCDLHSQIRVLQLSLKRDGV